MDYLGRAIIYNFLNTFLKLLESYTFVQLSCYSKLIRYLAPSILCILRKEIRTGFPALTAAYAALSINYYINHGSSSL